MSNELLWCLFDPFWSFCQSYRSQQDFTVLSTCTTNDEQISQTLGCVYSNLHAEFKRGISAQIENVSFVGFFFYLILTFDVTHTHTH